MCKKQKKKNPRGLAFNIPRVLAASHWEQQQAIHWNVLPGKLGWTKHPHPVRDDSFDLVSETRTSAAQNTQN